MLPQLTRKLRLALVLATAGVYVGTHVDVAAAKGKKSKESDSDSDDEGDEDDSASSDKEGEGEEDAEEAKDQPPVTAGGLFTLNTYPTRENLRPLTMTEGIMQLRASIGTDISNKGAFSSFGYGLDAQYGLKDNFTLRAGINMAYLGSGNTVSDGSMPICDPAGGGICPGSSDAASIKQFNFYAGFEGSLLYDLFDIRVQARLNNRANAILENFCSPAQAGDPNNPQDPSLCGAQAQSPTLVHIPNGNYQGGPVEFAIDLGFPFRYAIKPEIAITALDTLMAIHFSGRPGIKNGGAPDFIPSIGVAVNPIAPLSIVLYAQLIVLNFDFTNSFLVPATLRIEVSPTQKLDIGLEFTFLNLKPIQSANSSGSPGSPFDERFLSAFAQFRFGR